MKFNKSILAFFIGLFWAVNVFSQTTLTDLLTENLKNPMGLGVPQPRFSWKLQNKKRGIVQTAYEINVKQDDKTLWNSGKVTSDSSVMVTYKGPALKSNTHYKWQVKVWDNDTNTPAQSNVATFHTGFFKIADWKAKWITSGFAVDSIKKADPFLERPSPYFRKTFNTVKTVKSATLFATSHGIYEAYLNGKRVGDLYFTPGWTSYHNRLQYQAYDVTKLLDKNNALNAPNALGVVLANGWYRGNIGWGQTTNFYGSHVALLLQLEITYTDGTAQTITSDESWKVSTGEITYSEMFHGEHIDFNKENTGWMMPDYNDAKWRKVNVGNFDKNNLVAMQSEGVREHEIFKPVKVFTTPKGEKVIDFGQNLTGWVRMKIKGKAGHQVKLYHAEVLDKEGNFFTENLRTAKAEDIYTLKDDKEITVQPHFTFHGFRYVKVVNYPGQLKPENFEAVALYSDIDQTGSFSSSSKLINQLQSNIEWGQKGNFLDIPTDCNQRNERLGWTGDIQIFARTGLFNMRAHNFLVKWLDDVKVEQSPAGEIPNWVPTHGGRSNMAAWADAITIVPWELYRAYGDKKVLTNYYNSMKAYLESIQKVTNNDLWDKAATFGDWLAYSPEKDEKKSPAVSKPLIAQAYYANSVRIFTNSARILGKKEDAEKYDALLKRVKEAFRKAFIDANGNLTSQTQAAYVIALDFGMIPPELEQKAADRLVELVNEYGHFTTGFLASPPLCHVLAKYGHQDLAFKLLEREQYPSWLYPITMGATTFWERWNGIKPDGNFQTQKPQSNSFNHYAHAAIGDFLYRKIAGISTDESVYESVKGIGYKHININPMPGGSLTNAKATLQTYYGTISSGWAIKNGKFILDVEVPVNTTATIYLPTNNIQNVIESNSPVKSANGVSIESKAGDKKVAVKVGSGVYQFIVNAYK